MKKLILLLIAGLTVASYAQPGNHYEHSGKLGQYYGGSQYINWEETCMLLPPGPGIVEEIHIYLYGENPGIDTIRIVGAPTEGAFPPTIFANHLNSYGVMYLEYDGNAGWRTVDVSSLNIRAGGNNRIAVQHLIQAGGPYWIFDNNSQAAGKYTSFINNVFTPNPDFYNLRGTLVSLAGGDYLVGLTMKYDYPAGETSAPRPEPQLIDITEEAGLPILKNAMVSVADWNKDGYDDIAVGNRFFQNNGDGSFSEITLQDENYNELNINCFATIWGDIDGDGNIDFFAARGMGNDRIYYGNSNGTFTEDTDPVLYPEKPTVTPMLLDMNGNGLLDIFVAYGRTSSGGQETYYQNQLFENTGDRKFKNITQSSGIAAAEPSPYLDCWGASLCDYNNDGLTDIFVATYRLAPDLLYRNNGDGTFTNVAADNQAQGVPTANANYFGHGMGSDWGDFDNDGDVDLLIGNLSHPDERALLSNKSLILENTQNGNLFVDKTTDMNLRFLEMNAGIMWIDMDNDSWLDVVHAHYSYNSYSDVQQNPILNKPSRYYINQGPENDFYLKDVSWEIGGDIHGAWTPVRLDINNNGSMDIIMASNQENIKLFRNDIKDKGNWIGVILEGDAKEVNMNAYGSSVVVYAGEHTYFRSLPGTVHTGRASQNTNKLHFGLGDIESVDRIEVTFPNGETKEVIPDDINQYIKIQYGDGTSVNDEAIALMDLKIFPNPAENAPSLEFYLPEAGVVLIELFDLSGKKVSDISNNFMDEGTHQISVNTEQMPSGTYNLRLKTKKISVNKKIILYK